MSQEKHLEKAGDLLLRAAISQAKTATPLTPNKRLNDETYHSLLAQARSHLVKVDPLQDPHRFGAAKMALDACEAVERGEDPVGGIEMFSGLTEGVLGGESKIDLGGKQRVSGKPSANESFLRAALCQLWEADNDRHRRNELIKDARSLTKIKTKRAIIKLVDNFNQRHDSNVVNSRSPQSIHISLIKELIEGHGYKRLRDFRLISLHGPYHV
jgi:hypothetical protein